MGSDNPVEIDPGSCGFNLGGGTVSIRESGECDVDAACFITAYITPTGFEDHPARSVRNRYRSTDAGLVGGPPGPTGGSIQGAPPSLRLPHWQPINRR